MEREIMPDYAAEAFYRHLIPQNVFERSGKPQEETNQCVVFCKKGASKNEGQRLTTRVKF